VSGGGKVSMSQSIVTVAPPEFGRRLIVAAVLNVEDCD
jgi:hypothetical protein